MSLDAKRMHELLNKPYFNLNFSPLKLLCMYMYIKFTFRVRNIISPTLCQIFELIGGLSMTSGERDHLSDIDEAGGINNQKIELRRD